MLLRADPETSTETRSSGILILGGKREEPMTESGCATCSFRAKVDRRPSSILGRLWRWHTNFCPGWRSYMTSLPDDEKKTLIDRYNFPPAKFA